MLWVRARLRRRHGSQYCGTPVVGLAVGGCAELSSTVHRLVHHLATQAGEREAKDTGEEVEECILAQKQRIGRRIARQVWRDIYQHSRARRQFAGPPPEPTYKINREMHERPLSLVSHARDIRPRIADHSTQTLRESTSTSLLAGPPDRPPACRCT